MLLQYHDMRSTANVPSTVSALPHAPSVTPCGSSGGCNAMLFGHTIYLLAMQSVSNDAGFPAKCSSIYLGTRYRFIPDAKRLADGIVSSCHHRSICNLCNILIPYSTTHTHVQAFLPHIQSLSNNPTHICRSGPRDQPLSSSPY